MRSILSKQWKKRIALWISLSRKKYLLEPEFCWICQKDKSHAHHWSYLPEHIFEVMWLCPTHHCQWHREFTPLFPTGNELKIILTPIVLELISKQHKKFLEHTEKSFRYYCRKNVEKKYALQK